MTTIEPYNYNLFNILHRPIIMIFTRTDHVPIHNNGCGLLPRKVVHASFKA